MAKVTLTLVDTTEGGCTMAYASDPEIDRAAGLTVAQRLLLDAMMDIVDLAGADNIEELNRDPIKTN